MRQNAILNDVYFCFDDTRLIVAIGASAAGGPSGKDPLVPGLGKSLALRISQDHAARVRVARKSRREGRVRCACDVCTGSTSSRVRDDLAILSQRSEKISPHGVVILVKNEGTSVPDVLFQGCTAAAISVSAIFCSFSFPSLPA